MSIDDKIVIQNSQFNLEQMDDEQLLYNPLLTKTIYLNSTATLIWNLCAGHHTVGEIIIMLSEQFPESADQIKNDVIETIDELIKSQAIFVK